MNTVIANLVLAASVATNLLATVLIAYKLWLVTIVSDINDDWLFVTGSTENPGAVLV